MGGGAGVLVKMRLRCNLVYWGTGVQSREREF